MGKSAAVWGLIDKANRSEEKTAATIFNRVHFIYQEACTAHWPSTALPGVTIATAGWVRCWYTSGYIVKTSEIALLEDDDSALF